MSGTGQRGPVYEKVKGRGVSLQIGRGKCVVLLVIRFTTQKYL